MTTITRTKPGVERTNQMIRWFFTDPASRYGLSGIITLARATKDSVQNAVRREMIAPDEATPGGRRIYRPLTVADFRVATILVEMNVSPTMAFEAARRVNVKTLSWYAGRSWKEGDPMPAFNRDIRRQFAVLSWLPSANVDIVPLDGLSKILWDAAPITHTVIPIGRVWIDLADYAQNRSLRRLKAVISGQVLDDD